VSFSSLNQRSGIKKHEKIIKKIRNSEKLVKKWWEVSGKIVEN
jgi:hypothetical protein